ncbi:hypothetical protein M409DRAFT_50158 [Zasmidium cellare ATCC 36951]|uniref:Uncharacterized protein n=1 Tax=Zasmidium cellare ATCC 36951 TaxID=1080233 RepID=A0A6A6D0D0_ZASCE|nr:uncharacterized protein M409DRAFT_50158 [Zasmidium cellare ATCC 36951]KAF2172463.1 hypothetical protein M409DRAFT_50158 [Zasmidium cellare ATCC 36951]
MFVPPPPIRLSREEVDRRLAAQRGRPESSSAGGTGDQRTNSSSSTREEQQNATSTQRNRRHHQAIAMLHSSPPHTPPPRTPPPLAPHERGGGIDRRAIGSPRPDSSAARRTLPVFEEPRRAPATPKRPPRPPSELFLPPPPEPPKHGRVPTSRPLRVDESPPLPPIPDKSPLRQVVTLHREESQSSLSPRPLFSDMSFDKPATPPSAKPLVERSVSGSILSVASSSSTKTAPKAPSRQHAALTDATFNAALASMKARAKRDSGPSTSSLSTTASSIDPGSLVRSSTAPPSLYRANSFSSLKVAKSAVFRGSGSACSPTKSRHARKLSATRSLDSQRMTTAAHMRAALLEAEDRKRTKRPDSIVKAERPIAPPSAPTRWKKRRKGETMSMLLDAGFFPVEEIIYGKNKKPKRPPSELSFRINLPPRLSFIEKDLPTTPSSITTTPTELYNTSPTTPRSRTRNRKSGGSTGSPLSQISESDVNVDANDGGGGGWFRKESEQLSPTRLAAIPEDSAAGENSPLPSGVSTPVATQIHLRGGSIITVTPPELTAWQPTLYIHGPIKLPTPQIMPRKNSVASLEPFQEAIDQVYQHALAIPRRRSDDMVVDDICEFFDEFGFEMVSFDGDRLSLVESELDEIEEMEYETDLERFSTPPNEQPVASPVEVVIAKDIIETAASKPPPAPVPTVVLPMPEVIAPPVENEETLRARGIARLSRSSAGSMPVNEQKDSLTIGKDREGSLPLLPAPEESMLDAVLQPSHRKGRDSASYASSVQSSRRGRDSTSYATSTHSSRFGKDSASVHSSQIGAGGQGFEWDDDVEEIDAGSAWFAPVAAPKKPGISRGLSTRKTRNPVAKMRRLVATASTIL